MATGDQLKREGEYERPERWIGWHVLANGKTLGYCDGRHVRKGSWLQVRNMMRPISRCEYGFHACRRFVDLPSGWFKIDSTLAIVELANRVLDRHCEKSVSWARRPLTKRIECWRLGHGLDRALKRKLGQKSSPVCHHEQNLLHVMERYYIIRKRWAAEPVAEHDLYVWCVRWIARQLGWSGRVGDEGILTLKKGR